MLESSGHLNNPKETEVLTEKQPPLGRTMVSDLLTASDTQRKGRRRKNVSI